MRSHRCGHILSVVGSPILLLQVQSRLLQHRMVQYRYGFIYSQYTTAAWFWEELELSRKFLLTSVIIYVKPRTTAQLAAASTKCILNWPRVIRSAGTNARIPLQNINDVFALAYMEGEAHTRHRSMIFESVNFLSKSPKSDHTKLSNSIFEPAVLNKSSAGRKLGIYV